MHDAATFAAIHEALAGTPLAAEFAEIQKRALAVPLVGWYDRTELISELEYRAEAWDEPELIAKIEQLSKMSDAEIIELHYEAGDVLMNDLHQSPMSYVIDAIPSE